MLLTAAVPVGRLATCSTAVARVLSTFVGSTALRGYASTAAASDDGKLHVCVVGSGPAGMYTVDRLLKRYGDGIRVSLLDRLPTPFGLVRSGVAPDHQDTKNVINQFSGVAGDPRVTFLGGVAVGRDVGVEELRSMHHAVVLSYGAESDRRLGVPGEDGPGVLAAREFVWWYNGHPDAAQLDIDLSKIRSVAICGIGNVALDCARVLLGPPDRFVPTDLAAHTLRQLAGGGGRAASGVREVHLVARRGPVQAACTPKELKELLSEVGGGITARVAAPEQLSVSAADAAEMKATRLKRRVHELVSKAVEEGAKRGQQQQQQQQQGEDGSRRDLYFQFYRNPMEVLRGADGAVTGLRVERTEVRPPAPGSSAPATAVGTGVTDDIPCQLVLKSIGYKGLPLQGVAFDAKRGVVPNVAGRVLMSASDPGSGADRGLYVVGWLKRGPSGIIGTNLVDAEETAGAVAEDAEGLVRDRAGQTPVGSTGLKQLLSDRGVRCVPWSGWRALDEHEQAAGRAAGRVREKVVQVEQMLRVAGV